jgi:PPOX class probable F420-dependent enzyme
MGEFAQMDISTAKEFLARHHWGVLTTRRKEGSLQMSPVTVGIDAAGHAIISSRETAYKVNNLRRDPRAAVCVFTNEFHGEGWVQINGSAEIVSLPEAIETLVYLERQAKGENRDWPSFHQRMVREKRVVIRISIDDVGPKRRG